MAIHPDDIVSAVGGEVLECVAEVIFRGSRYVPDKKNPNNTITAKPGEFIPHQFRLVSCGPEKPVEPVEPEKPVEPGEVVNTPNINEYPYSCPFCGKRARSPKALKNCDHKPVAG